MVTINFTQLRQNAKEYFDAVERGEVVNVKRHGKIIAQIVSPTSRNKSWKRPVAPLVVPGASLSKLVLKERARQ